MTEASGTADFGHVHYEALLVTALGTGYRFRAFEDDLEGRDSGAPTVYLRHDVDRDPSGAAALGALATRHGVRGSFFFLLRCESYNLLGSRCREAIASLLAGGHAVGLHFSHTDHQATDDLDVRTAQVAADSALFEQVTGVAVRSFSMHNPDDTLGVQVPGLVNAYSPAYFDDAVYVSDSNRRWKPLRPLDAVVDPHPVVQVLVHPEWHGPEAGSEREAILHWVREVARTSLEENNSQNRTLEQNPATLEELGRFLIER